MDCGLCLSLIFLLRILQPSNRHIFFFFCHAKLILKSTLTCQTMQRCKTENLSSDQTKNSYFLPMWTMLILYGLAAIPQAKPSTHLFFCNPRTMFKVLELIYVHHKKESVDIKIFQRVFSPTFVLHIATDIVDQKS